MQVLIAAANNTMYVFEYIFVRFSFKRYGSSVDIMAEFGL
jgi:hypothetical protein